MIPTNPVPSSEIPAPVMLSIPNSSNTGMVPLQPGSNVMVPSSNEMPQQIHQFQQFQQHEAIQPVNNLHPFAASVLGNTSQKYAPTPLAADNGKVYIDGPFKIIGWSEKSFGIVGPAMASYGNLIPIYTGLASKNFSKNIGKLPDNTGAQEGYWFPRSQLNEMSAKISTLNQKIMSNEINNPEVIGSMILSNAVSSTGPQQISSRTHQPSFSGALPSLPEISTSYPNHFITDKGIEYRAILTTVPVPIVGKKINITFSSTQGNFEYSIIATNGLSFTVEGYNSKLEIKLINLEYQICNQSIEHKIEFL